MTPTHCPYCALQCGMNLVPEQSGLLTVQPRKDFPTNKGGLCQKGWTSADLLSHPDRLLTPLVRGAKDGPLRPASWDEALSRVAAGITASQRIYGRDSVGVFGGGGLTNEKAYWLGKFARVALRTPHIDYNGRFQGIESPGKMKLATAGCPRNCSEAMVKDVGAVAVEGGKWEIYVGGAAGAHIRKGDILCVVDSHEAVIQIMGRFMQYYIENAKYLERTYSFVPRVGLDNIKAIVVDDSEGIAARLDAAMQATVDAYVNPWLEADQPATANQFVSTLPVLA